MMEAMPAAAEGHFIVIEGIDGAGTTTQTRLLCERLGERGLVAHATREPSDGPIGRLLREMLHGQHAPVSGAAMTLLFAADRMDHLAREIEPQLLRGVHVVSDRYYHSSLAYQSEEAERALVAAANRSARTPDLTLFLRVRPQVAAERRHQQGRQTERYDDHALQERIARNYQALCEERAARERIVVIDGEQPVDAVLAACLDQVMRLWR
jgi:dTMP kinase